MFQNDLLSLNDFSQVHDTFQVSSLPTLTANCVYISAGGGSATIVQLAWQQKHKLVSHLLQKFCITLCHLGQFFVEFFPFVGLSCV